MLDLRIVLAVLLVGMGSKADAQRDSLLFQFDKSRIADQKTGMVILGSWALGNIGTGIVLRSQTQGEDLYFHQMNALWNTVNASIAGFGYWNALRESASSDPGVVLGKQLKLEKSLLFNTGLDVAYMATGAWMLEYSKTQGQQKRKDQFRGYGRSLVLQGAFLLVFDASFYAIESRHSRDLQRLLELFYVSPGGIGFHKNF
jgi:hypothetical protein